MRKSKIFDASGNSLVKPGKKIVNRRTNDQCDNKRKSTSSEVTGSPCSEDAENVTETVGSKSLLRRPTFKEFEGKFRNSKGSRLLKSQSLDQDSAVSGGGVTSSRPPTPGSKTHQSRSGLKGLSRRAREVFLNNSSQHQHQQTEVISSKQSFMGRFFPR